MSTSADRLEAPGRIEQRGDVTWLLLDRPGRAVNTLSFGLVEWFGEQLDAVEASSPRGLVIASGKPGSFVAGADIEELAALRDPDEVAVLLARAHALLERLIGQSCPVVAAIDGGCLGGGLELALGCDWRVATDGDGTRLGLPEVQLGLIPGLGGTQRLPRLVGVAAALDLVLTGRQIRSRRALRLGLVDEVCHPNALAVAVERCVARGKRPKARPRGGGLRRLGTDLVARSALGSRLVYDRARALVEKKSGGHYPAPTAAVDVIEAGLRVSLAEGLALESRAFRRLVVTPQAKALMGLFFAKTRLDRRAKELSRQALSVGEVGVLGAGLMGAGIAQVLAAKEVRVTLKDRDDAALGRGLGYVRDRFAELARRRRWSGPRVEAAMARVRPTVEYSGFGRLDLVIEAVFEDLEIKQAVIREVEAVASEALVFASNTSTIPIGRLAAASCRPERVVGMHFFSPVHKMPLLEVIRHPLTRDDVVATAVAVGRRMGKTVIVVNDGPGFFTSRVLAPFLNEAGWCLAEGARVEEVDRALRGWGWPVGPLTLLDEVGLDIAHHAGRTMVESFGDRLSPPSVFDRLIAEKRLGRKAGRGFYRYDGKKKVVDEGVYELLGWRSQPLSSDEIAERCWLAMLNEVAFTLADGVIQEPSEVDLAVIFGLGFPPFRGGILRAAEEIGLDVVVGRLSAFADRLGERFRPAPLLVDMAREGRTFFGGKREET